MPAPIKPAVVTPPSPPAPVWTRLELLANCTSFDTNQFANHTGAIVSIFGEESDGVETLLSVKTYGQGLVSIIPPVGNWVEQALDYTNTFQATGVTIQQLQAGANNTTSVNLTLDGGVGPEKLMRYLKI
jgi:hypothetical protein